MSNFRVRNIGESISQLAPIYSRDTNYSPNYFLYLFKLITISVVYFINIGESI